MRKINFESLPSTNTPLSAENLNLMQANIEEAINLIEMAKGTPSAGVSFDDLILTGETGVYTISPASGIEQMPGFPTGAYPYGTLITLNPTKSTANHFSTAQIYIPDIPSNYGIYFRTRSGANWLRITGTAVQPVT